MNLLGPVLCSVLLTGQLGTPRLDRTESGLGGMERGTPATPPATQYNTPATNTTEADYMDHSGWGLSGSKGRLYFFGNTGFADCTHNGQRHVVSLRKEADNTVPDPTAYMYYTEIGSGDRWSIAKHPERGAYAVYFQRANDRLTPQGKPKWIYYQNAQLIQDSRNQQHRSPIAEEGVAADEAPRLGNASVDRSVLLLPTESPIITTRYVEPVQVVQPGRCCGN